MSQAATTVIALLLGEGLRTTACGLAAGMLAAWILRRSVAGMLVGVSPGDVATFTGVALVLALVSLLSAWLPARRVAGVDPSVALRRE